MRHFSGFLAFGVLLGTGCIGGGSGDVQGGWDFYTAVDYGYEGGAPEDDVSKVDTGTVINTGGDAPANELMIKITGPSGSGYAASSGMNVSLSGLIFGKFTEISYMASSGDSGKASDAPFWYTPAIRLNKGDNLITVTAIGETETVTDHIVVTYNPAFMFPYPVQVRPKAVFVGDTIETVATIQLGPFGSLVNQTLTLQLVNETGGHIKDLGSMRDNGSMPDEIDSDGIYTTKALLPCDGSTPALFVRAAVQVKDELGNAYPALSPQVRVDCVPRLSVATCNQHKQTLDAAKAAYVANLGTGTAAARAAAIAVFQADPAYAESSQAADLDGLWVRWNDGILGALNVADGVSRGGAGAAGDDEVADGDLASVESALIPDNAILSKKMLLLSPFNGDFVGRDETQFVANIAGKISCPAYDLTGPKNSATASLSLFRRMNEFGVVAIASHGDIYFRSLSAEAKKKYGWSHMGSQEVIWTGEPVACEKLTQTVKSCTSSSQCPSGTECVITNASFGGGSSSVSGYCHDATQVDLESGRVAMGDSTYGITPSFVLRHSSGNRFPNSLVYLGTCRSLWNGSLAAALFASGARTISGFSGVVTSQFAFDASSSYFAAQMEQQQDSGDAYGVGRQDPDNPGSFFRQFGARHLTIYESDILNESWETGDLMGWDRDGDGRVITKLGVARPAGGKFMSVISTGLGFTTELGSIEQTFCVPAGTNSMSFFWKYYSEEFHEWCGSEFQDTFQAKLVDTAGKEYPIVNLSVDDLCKKGDNGCYSCGGNYVGLTPSDVQFDQGDCHKTDWQKATYNVAQLAGKGPVTLKFFCTDKGDSIYDTAVLVDAVKFGGE